MIEPVQIDPEALYDDAALRQCLGLAHSTLSAARRVGVLRYTRKGRRTFYKGAWILTWLESEAEPRQDLSNPRTQGDAKGGGA